MSPRATGIVIVAAALAAAVPRAASGRDDARALVSQAYLVAYDLNYPEALALARRAVSAAPDDPGAHRAVASILWQEILFSRGAVTIDYFMGGVSKQDVSMPKVPLDRDAEFRREVDTATRLADARLKANPKDVQALYDSGAANGIHASYIASIEGRMSSAFGPARRAFDAHEKVLDRDPARVEANLIVGTYRYIIAGLSLPTRLFAYIAGFGGDRARGIRMVEQAALSGPATNDAKFALILLYAREQRYADALKNIADLQTRFPRNRMLVLEEGAMNIRAGKQFEAEAALTRGLAALDRDTRPLFPGERALWFAKRGTARVNLNHRADASADLSTALGLQPVGWVRGRILVEQGKIADLEGRRPDALARYREGMALCERHRDPICEAEAGRLIKRPFQMGNPR